MIFVSNRKKRWNSAFQMKKVMFEKSQGLRHREEGEVEIGSHLLGNDKNKVIVDKVLSYF